MNLEIADKSSIIMITSEGANPVGPGHCFEVNLDPNIICISLYYTNMYIYNDFLSIDRK